MDSHLQNIEELETKSVDNEHNNKVLQQMLIQLETLTSSKEYTHYHSLIISLKTSIVK